MPNPSVCTSLDAFVYTVAVYGVAKGYYLYASGSIPEGKDPEEIDWKLTHKYGINISKRSRAYRKSQGFANLQYVRFRQHYFLLATPGKHENFFHGHLDQHGRPLPWEQRGEGAILRDARRSPILIGDYSISHINGKTCVQIQRDVYRVLRAYCLEMATKRRDPAALESLLRETFPYLPFRPIQRQIQAVITDINQLRRQKKLPAIAASSCLKRTPAPHLRTRAA